MPSLTLSPPPSGAPKSSSRKLISLTYHGSHSLTDPLLTHSLTHSPKSPTRKLVTQPPQCTVPSRSK